MSGRWLLLAHQLPTSRSNARVKTWRRLQQLGAVPTRNSVYVLPNTEPCREDFEWLRSEIVSLGGEATVFTADALGGDGEQAIVESFRRARNADYEAIRRDAERTLTAGRARRNATSSSRETLERQLHLLQQRLSDVESIDFFNAPAAQKAVASVRALEQLCRGGQRAQAPKAATALSARDFQNRRWVTRARPGVDRMSSAWLVRRFIDPKATFAFVDRPGATDVPFDMYEGDFTHHGPLCTFETLVERFGITDAAAGRIAQIVHDLDMKESRFAPPEAPAVGRMVEGLRHMHVDDLALLEHGIAMFEALARSFQSTGASVGRTEQKAESKGRTKSRRKT